METTLANLKIVFKYDKINNELWFYHIFDEGLGSSNETITERGIISLRDEINREDPSDGRIGSDTGYLSLTNHCIGVTLIMYNGNNEEIWQERLDILAKPGYSQEGIIDLERIPYSPTRSKDFEDFNNTLDVNSKFQTPRDWEIVRKIKNFNKSIYDQITRVKIMKHYANPHIIDSNVVDWFGENSTLTGNNCFISFFLPTHLVDLENEESEFIFKLYKQSDSLENRFDKNKLIERVWMGTKEDGIDNTFFIEAGLSQNHYNSPIRLLPTWKRTNNPNIFETVIGSMSARGYVYSIKIGTGDLPLNQAVNEEFNLELVKKQYGGSSQYITIPLGKVIYSYDGNCNGISFLSIRQKSNELLETAYEFRLFVLKGEAPCLHRELYKEEFFPGHTNEEEGNVPPRTEYNQTIDPVENKKINEKPYFSNSVHINENPIPFNPGWAGFTASDLSGLSWNELELYSKMWIDLSDMSDLEISTYPICAEGNTGNTQIMSKYNFYFYYPSQTGLVGYNNPNNTSIGGPITALEIYFYPSIDPYATIYTNCGFINVEGEKYATYNQIPTAY